jgi:hypothetical protein
MKQSICEPTKKVPTANLAVKIYLIHFLNNEVYIGYTTTTLNKRFSNHKHVSNDIVSINVIDEFVITSPTKYLKKEIESYWIEQFRQWGFSLRNKNNGGGGPLSNTISEETRKKQSEMKINKPLSTKHKHNISLSHKNRDNSTYVSGMKNKTHSFETKNKISISNSGINSYLFGKIAKNVKPILQFDINNKFIKEWSSISLASKELKINRTSIIETCQVKQKSSGGFIWRYKN